MSIFVKLTNFIPAIRRRRERRAELENRARVLQIVDEMLERIRQKRADKAQTLAEIEFKKSFLPKGLCKHRKGGFIYSFGWDKFRGGTSKVYPDYAVWHHTFPDNSESIKCLICGRVWTPGKRGWKQALRMVEQSTNKKSASERKPDPELVTKFWKSRGVKREQ